MVFLWGCGDADAALLAEHPEDPVMGNAASYHEVFPLFLDSFIIRSSRVSCILGIIYKNVNSVLDRSKQNAFMPGNRGVDISNCIFQYPFRMHASNIKKGGIMKKSKIACGALLLLVSLLVSISCGGSPKKQPARQESPVRSSAPDLFLIANHQVMGLSSGMTLQKAEEIVGKGNIKVRKEAFEGGSGPVESFQVEINLPDESWPVIETSLSGNKLDVLAITDSRFHTRGRNGIHSILGDIKKEFPDLEIFCSEGRCSARSRREALAFYFNDSGNGPNDQSVIDGIGILNPESMNAAGSNSATQ
jgi:hypothetical protein